MKVYQCVFYRSTSWIARGRRIRGVLGWSVWVRWSVSLSLGSEKEEDHGRAGERGSTFAPPVPVPRPVAGGLAGGWQVSLHLHRLRTAQRVWLLRGLNIMSPLSFFFFFNPNDVFVLCSYRPSWFLSSGVRLRCIPPADGADDATGILDAMCAHNCVARVLIDTNEPNEWSVAENTK